MRKSIALLLINFILMFGFFGCKKKREKEEKPSARMAITAQEILGNPDYLAMSYGGYRENSRSIQPTIDQLKEDMRILDAMGVHVLRTYNTKEFPHAANLLEAIHQLNQEDSGFEMYVMLGAWINCKGAFTDTRDHDQEDEEFNRGEIDRAVELANQYPEVVKMIAVGNEAMVKWAESYYVHSWIILKWVNHLQELKKEGGLSSDIWITSSDNFASWGGGGAEYHVPSLKRLWEAVDFVSMHTYPMHDTHYNPQFWGVAEEEMELSKEETVHKAMWRARNYSIAQYDSVRGYMESRGLNKPIHIGETGWASYSNELYGNEGSHATDEYKEGIYYKLTRDWTAEKKMSCFYFEAFDEPWKDAGNPGGSENYFGLFTKEGRAKYALWKLVDQKTFQGLTRGGNPIKKTYGGNINLLMDKVKLPVGTPSNNNIQ